MGKPTMNIKLNALLIVASGFIASCTDYVAQMDEDFDVWKQAEVDRAVDSIRSTIPPDTVYQTRTVYREVPTVNYGKLKDTIIMMKDRPVSGFVYANTFYERQKYVYDSRGRSQMLCGVLEVDSANRLPYLRLPDTVEVIDRVDNWRMFDDTDAELLRDYLKDIVDTNECIFLNVIQYKICDSARTSYYQCYDEYGDACDTVYSCNLGDTLYMTAKVAYEESNSILASIEWSDSRIWSDGGSWGIVNNKQRIVKYICAYDLKSE